MEISLTERGTEMTGLTTVVPAYGRDYKTPLEALTDYRAGKDFRINQISHPYDGRYLSIRDQQDVSIRFNQLRQCVVSYHPEDLRC